MFIVFYSYNCTIFSQVYGSSYVAIRNFNLAPILENGSRKISSKHLYLSLSRRTSCIGHPLRYLQNWQLELQTIITLWQKRLIQLLQNVLIQERREINLIRTICFISIYTFLGDWSPTKSSPTEFRQTSCYLTLRISCQLRTCFDLKKIFFFLHASLTDFQSQWNQFLWIVLSTMD